MTVNRFPISWHGYLAALAAVMAGVAVTQHKWTAVWIEAAMCILFFVREAQVQIARRRRRDQSSDSAPPS